MEVNQDNYKKQLLPILKQIAFASFISFDLEMSGIHKKSRFGTMNGGHDNGKPSLQQLYDETRAAAETFQVLQVGFTIVEANHEKDYYLARPYNFNLSPLFFLDNRVKDRFPERKITFSSSAADFLQGEGFDIGRVFSQGVFYLSHAEEEETRARFKIRNDREGSKADVVIPPGDTKALEFYRSARKTISAWVNAEKPEFNFVNIGDPTGDMNGYQRLLVHQLVKNEFPGYRSFARGRQSFVQIEKVNVKKETEFDARKLNEFNHAVAKQIGLRWIFEALTGGDLSGIPTTWFSDASDDKSELTQAHVDKEFEAVMTILKEKEIILVGHNLFTDLVCLYTTFIGPLPKDVEDFQERIHSLFPMIIDTKYLATEGQDSMSTVMRKSLGELVEPFKKVHTPLILLDEKHTSYGASLDKKHEAGFDSWMTAELYVKLASKIHADRSRTEMFECDTDYDDDDDTSLSFSTALEKSNSRNSLSEDESAGGAKLASHSSEGELLDFTPLTIDGDHSMSMTDNLPPGYHAHQRQLINSRPRCPFIKDFNPFSVLQNASAGAGSGGDDSGVEVEPKPEQWIPQIGSTFWDLYANKLRVNASDVGVCDLNDGFEE